MKVSINILTWNNRKTIEKILVVLHEEMKDVPHEYIFVDNGSDDGTKDVLRKWPFTVYVDNPKNYGISIGKNQGINASTGDYILMLDGDVVPVPNSIRLMLNFLEDAVNVDALGMFPNKFSTSEDHAEKRCEKLVGFRKYKCCCLYYGMFRRKIFDAGLRLSEDGHFGKPGYGWEDHDFFKKMQLFGIDQWVAHINRENGKYFHDINSSIRAMGREKYIDTSILRHKQFTERWDAAGQSSDSAS